MAYTAPSVTASSGTFAQLQAGGLAGQVELLITANSGLTARQITLARAARAGQFEDTVRAGARLVDTFLRGDPIALAEAKQDLLDVAWAVSLLKAAVDEIGVLIDANAGTLTTKATGIGDRQGVRTFP